MARVYGVPITLDDVAMGVTAYGFRRGLTPDDLGDPGSQRRLAVEVTVLESLVLEEIVAGYARNHKASVESVTAEAVDAEFARIRRSLGSDEELARRLEAAGLGPGSLRQRLAARLVSQAWIAERLDPAVAVTEAEIRAFYDEHQSDLVLPATVRARHLFLSTVENPDRDTEIRALADLLEKEGADFAQLAAEHSEDSRSAPLGGDLKYFRRDRMPADFVAAVWDLPVGQRSDPFRTAIGWHIVEVLDRRPERPATLDELAPELRATLENHRRSAALATLKTNLKKHAARHLEYYLDTLLESAGSAGGGAGRSG